MRDPHDCMTMDFIGAPVPRRIRKTKAELAEQSRIRMRRMRERKRAAGLVSVDMPRALAERIRAIGVEAWLDEVRSAPPRVIEVPVEVVKVVEVPGPPVITERVVRVEVPVDRPVPTPLSRDQQRAIEIGRAVYRLPRWKRVILSLLGVQL